MDSPNYHQQQRFYPTIVSPPPVAPPPPPPSSPSDDGDDSSSDGGGGRDSPMASYHGQYPSRARNGTIPAITNYGLSPSMSGQSTKKQPIINSPYAHFQSPSPYGHTDNENSNMSNMGCFQWSVPFSRPSSNSNGVGFIATGSSGSTSIYDTRHDDNSNSSNNNNNNTATIDHGTGGSDGRDYSNYSMSSILRGDTTIRPNTGNSNQEFGTLIPGSLREKANTLRVMTVVSTSVAVIWEGIAFPIRIISLHVVIDPPEIVLGAYLGIFCLLVLGVELNVPLRDSFGFLYNPLTRGLTLLLMSTMALGVLKSWWESLLGLAFVVTGVGYVYTYIRHPEYRRWQDYNQSNQRPLSPWEDIRMYWDRRPFTSRGGGGGGGGGRSGGGSSGGYGSVIWADPDDNEIQRLSSTWDTIRQTSEEARSLLHNV